MAAILDYNMFSDYHNHIAISPVIDTMHKNATGGPLYYQQHEVIQLIEVAAPPPLQEQHPSTITSSSVASSSSYTSSSCDESSIDSEEESAGSSYCSSDPEEMEESSRSCCDDTFGTRLNRVLAWRDGFAKAMGVAISPVDVLAHPYASLLKRKIDDDSADDDAVSLSSKRSRSSSHAERNANPWSRRRLSSHSCSACDCDFPTRQGLQEHGRVSRLGDACRVAVEYGCEP